MKLSEQFEILSVMYINLGPERYKKYRESLKQAKTFLLQHYGLTYGTQVDKYTTKLVYLRGRHPRNTNASVLISKRVDIYKDEMQILPYLIKLFEDK